MPKELHDRLEKEANKKGLKGKRRAAYIYGTMRETGWKPERERKGNPTSTMRAEKRRQVLAVKGVELT